MFMLSDSNHYSEDVATVTVSLSRARRKTAATTRNASRISSATSRTRETALFGRLREIAAKTKFVEVQRLLGTCGHQALRSKRARGGTANRESLTTGRPSRSQRHIFGTPI